MIADFSGPTIYVQGDAQAAQSRDSNAYTLNGQTVRSYKTTTQVDYSAHYRAILMASSQIAGGRSIHLTDNRSAFSNEGYPAPPDPMPMVDSMRKSAANQIFVSLHPTVSKVRRYIGGSKSKFSKQAVNLANAGLWAEAVAAAEQGVQDKPKDEGGRFVLAIVYQGAGRYEDADRVLRELVGLSGKSKYAEALQENKSMAGDAARYRKQL